MMVKKMTTIDDEINRISLYDQFDFEQQIMECWNITSDIKTVSEYILDAPLEANREDKAANMLIGIEALYNAKFDKLFRIFEQFNRERYELLRLKSNIEEHAAGLYKHRSEV